MKSTNQLTGTPRRTFRSLLRDPPPPSFDWHSVRTLMEEIAHVTEEPNGDLVATRHGHVLVLHPVRTEEASMAGEVLALRHFLEQPEPTPERTAGPALLPHLLLVIDHREARLFRSESDDGTPERILPRAPDDPSAPGMQGAEVPAGHAHPDPRRFFAAVAKALQTVSDQILIFGCGTGLSSEMDQFSDWARVHHPDLSRRILGTVVVDEHHLTDGQLLAKARGIVAKVRRARM